jgi:ferritin-like metal-binding protein YciE
MDEQPTQKINEAAEKFSNALGDSYQALTNHSVSTQEQQVAQLTQAFFEGVIEHLRAQTQGNQQMVQELVDQQQQQREAAQVPAQETSVKDYMRLLDYMCSYYRLLVASRSKRV